MEEKVMSKDESKANKEETKMVGGLIPIDLYWEFKVTHARRKENATKALEEALRLYVSVPDKEGN